MVRCSYDFEALRFVRYILIYFDGAFDPGSVLNVDSIMVMPIVIEDSSFIWYS